MHKQIIAIMFPDSENGWREDKLEVEDVALQKLRQPQEQIAKERE